MILLQDGSLYAMGIKNCCGQASAKDHFYSPVLVSVGSPTTFVCCSLNLTIVQTENKEWYAFGDARYQPSPIYGKSVSLTPERMDDIFSQGIQVKKLVATRHAFFLLTTDNDLYVFGKSAYDEIGIKNRKNIDNWTLCKTNIIDVQVGSHNSFVFIPNPFLIYEPQMEYTDAFICFQ